MSLSSPHPPLYNTRVEKFASYYHQNNVVAKYEAVQQHKKMESIKEKQINLSKQVEHP